MQRQHDIALVDDDAAVRNSLVMLLSGHGLAVSPAYASGGELLAALAAGRRPDVIVSDVRMPGMSGLELHEEIRNRGWRIPIVLITGHGQVSMAVQALKAGAADFIEKPFEEATLLDAIHRAVAIADRQGDAERRRADIEQRLSQLSPRQRQVMDLVVRGLSSKEIAAELGISPRTVETYRLWIMEKTGAANTAELVRMAMLLEAYAGQT